jgi:hypothetical protein
VCLLLVLLLELQLACVCSRVLGFKQVGVGGAPAEQAIDRPYVGWVRVQQFFVVFEFVCECTCVCVCMCVCVYFGRCEHVCVRIHVVVLGNSRQLQPPLQVLASPEVSQGGLTGWTEPVKLLH